MMMMQMWFYASTKVTLWFHSWSISSRGQCAPSRVLVRQSTRTQQAPHLT